MVTPRHHVVVIGAGYAGTMAANRLRRRPDVAVTVVNPRPEFVERTRLHRLVSGTHRATTDLAGLLAPGVRLVVDTVARVDAATRTVHLASGTDLGYDHLVYAAGSTAPPAAPLPGIAHAHDVASLDGARRLRSALVGLPPTTPVTVVGGGPTGIETAAELAAAGRAVRMVCGGRLAPTLGGRARRIMAAQLAGLGVDVVEQRAVREVRPDAVVLDDGALLAGPVTVWAGGFTPSGLAGASGLSTDWRGRLLTDETLTSVDDDRVVGAGDAVAPAGPALSMGCRSAAPLGAMAADTVLSRVAGTRPAAVDLGFYAIGVSVGRTVATVQLTERDDSPRETVFAGRLAARLKDAGLTGAVLALRLEGVRPGSAVWPRRASLTGRQPRLLSSRR